MAIDDLHLVLLIDVKSLSLFKLTLTLRLDYITCVNGPEVLFKDVLRVMSVGGHQGTSSYDSLLF